jgi:hypothetical protein
MTEALDALRRLETVLGEFTDGEVRQCTQRALEVIHGALTALETAEDFAWYDVERLHAALADPARQVAAL